MEEIRKLACLPLEMSNDNQSLASIINSQQNDIRGNTGWVDNRQIWFRQLLMQEVQFHQSFLM